MSVLDRGDLPTRRNKRPSGSSTIPIRSRLHAQPVIRDLEDYALRELGIDRGLWDSAAWGISGGDLKKLLDIITFDYGVDYLLSNYPRQFKLFFETQLPYWLGEVPPSYVVKDEDDDDEEVNASSIFIFSYLSDATITSSFNRLSVFSTPPPSIALLKTVDNIPDHHWPAFVTLGSFVYFIGGVCRSGDKLYSSKKMFAFDLGELNKKNHHEPPTLLDFPNMNVGKSNPLALVAKGRIYALSLTIRGLDKPALSMLDFNFPLDPHDWTLVDETNRADWFSGAFEVYDPSTREWTILPLPFTHLPLSHSSRLHFGHTVLHFSNTVGYAVIRDRLFFYSHIMGPRVYTFDIRTLRWKSYDIKTRPDVEPQDYYDSLAYQLLDNGMYGLGLLVKDTFYAFSSKDLRGEKLRSMHFGIWAYHVPKSLDDTLCHSGPLTGFSVDGVLTPSLSMRLQACVLFLGDGKFGCVHVKEIQSGVSNGGRLPKRKDWVRPPPPELQPRFTTFNVREVKVNDGNRCWHADSPVEYELCGLMSGSKEDFLACYAR